jgi:hypothetical protein
VSKRKGAEPLAEVTRHKDNKESVTTYISKSTGSQPTKEPNVTSALKYAAGGFYIFPVHYVLKDGHCSCNKSKCTDIGKHPATLHGLSEATTDIERIKSWWAARPNYNIGLATGHAGLQVIDIDVSDGKVGAQSLANLIERNGPLPDTLKQTTGSGGTHYFFHADKLYKNSTNKIGQHIDSRGKGGYVIVPPSNHRSGGQYVWDNESSIAELPDWLGANLAIEGAEPVAGKEGKAMLVAGDAGPAVSGQRQYPPLTQPQIEELLKFIPADERDVWLQVGSAIKTVMGEAGMPVWNAWAENGDGFKGDQDQERQWGSFKPGFYNAGTLVKLSRDNGWKASDLYSQEAHTAAEQSAVNGGCILITDRADKVLSGEVLGQIQPTAEKPPSFFRFGSAIARTRMVLNESSQTERATIEVLSESSLAQAINRALDFVRIGAKQKITPANAPKSLVSYIKESLPEDFKLPVVIGTTQTPVLMADGSIHDAPGYSAVTRLFHQPSLPLPAISENPGKKEIKAARDLLLEVFCDMPFAHESDRAHAIGLLILPFVRSLIAGDTPGHMLTKPVQGTGASLIAKATILLKTGEVGEPQNPPHENDEWQKTLLSSLLEAPDFCFFDDCGNLRSPALATVLTSGGKYKGRKLATNEMLYVPVRTVWMFAGNNPTLSKDLHRRMVHIRLDAGMADPAKGREFKHPELLPWLREMRPRVIAAVFTLARAWIRSGCPKSGTVLASFERWSQVVGGILKVAEVPGFLQTPAHRDAIDETELNASEFIQCWVAHKLRYPERFTRPKASELLKMAKGCELSIAGTLRSHHDDGISAEFVKNYLTKMRDRVFEVSAAQDWVPGQKLPVVPVKVEFAGSGGNRYWTFRHEEGALSGLTFDKLWSGNAYDSM